MGTTYRPRLLASTAILLALTIAALWEACAGVRDSRERRAGHA